MGKPLRIDDWFNFSNATPISEKEKEKWIDEAINYLESKPDEYMYSIASGDTVILVHKDELFNKYYVQELKPRKSALFELPKCICDIKIITSQGCQCDGS